MVVYLDSISQNRNAGGVLVFSEIISKALKKVAPQEILLASELASQSLFWRKLFGLNRFVFETMFLWLYRFSDESHFIFPNYYLPIFLRKSRQRRAVVVVHDIQHRVYPEYSSLPKRVWLNFCLRGLARSEATVVFISRATKSDFERFFGKCHRSLVIYNPVEMLEDIGPSNSSARSTTVGPRYALASYHYYPHKNFRGAIEVFRQLEEMGCIDEMRITGSRGTMLQDLLRELPEATRGKIKHLGYLSRQQLAREYRGSTAFLSMSQFEGFNLSAAEAAALRIPLLLSDIPVHRELFDQIAFFFEAEKIDLSSLKQYLANQATSAEEWELKAECAPLRVAEKYLEICR